MNLTKLKRGGKLISPSLLNFYLKMNKSFIFKFKTNRFNYIYDINTNEFLRVDEIIWDIVDFIYSKTENEIIKEFSIKYPSEVIKSSIEKIKKAIKEEGLFLHTRPEELKFYHIDEIKDKLNNDLHQLTLVVTEQCNLRCKYCVYSGNYYYERTHSNRKMPLDLAFKAIDFLFSHARDSAKIYISFYGGEPLLEFNLVKKCVEYVKVKNEMAHKDINFSITTNGILLNNEVINFLISNKIGLIISLDGPEKIHNRYRVFPTGNGTFEIIIKNLFKLRKRNKEYYDKYVGFNTTITPPYDLFELYNFFNHVNLKELFENQIHLINLMIQANTKFF